MKRFNIPINSELLTQICQGELKGKIPSVLCKVGEPEEADEQTIIFLEQEKLLEKVKASSAGLIITTEKFISELPERALLLVQKLLRRNLFPSFRKELYCLFKSPIIH